MVVREFGEKILMINQRLMNEISGFSDLIYRFQAIYPLFLGCPQLTSHLSRFTKTAYEKIEDI